MAATFSVTAPEGVHAGTVPGAYKEIIVTVTGDATPGSGYVFGLAQFQTVEPALFIYSIDVVNNWWSHANSNGAVAAYDTTSSTLFAMVQGTAGAGTLMVPTTASLAAASCQLRVRYR